MTVPSPANQDLSKFGFEVTASGSPLGSAIPVAGIETWSAVNKVPRARLVIFDGSPTEGTFTISNQATFLPGTEIAIRAGYGGTRDTIFSGIVVSHGVDIRRRSAPTLVVDMADRAIKLTVAQNTAIFLDQTDADIIKSLATAHGLQAEVPTMTTKHPSMIQFACSDWDTVLYRAEINGMVVTTEAGKLTLKAPDTSSNPVLRVAFGESVIDFRADMDAVSQLSESAVKSYAWDAAKQEVTEAGPSGVDVTEAGNVSSATLAQVCGASAVQQLTGAMVTQEDLQAWSSARLMRAKLAKIRGRVRFPGSALVKPGSVITLAGVGERFAGNVFVSAVHHEIRENSWYTTADFGLAPDWFADRVWGASAPAAGHLPPMKGLHTGVVTKVAEDPLGEFRVEVSLPLSRTDRNVWARLSSWYASNSFGAVFYPEIGDEVIVAFMNEDPRFPVILGSVYSSKKAPAKAPEQKNNVKALVTRSKLEMSFDDEKKAIVIKTPGGHVVTLSDDENAKKVTIVDSQSNGITLDNQGITLDSASNLALKAKGNVTIEATGNVTIEPTGNLTMKATGNAALEGTQVNVKAQAALSAVGNASAELKASGVVTVQGAIVKIN